MCGEISLMLCLGLCLLLLVCLLLMLLAPSLVAPSKSADQCARRRADRRALAGISRDRATDSPNRCTARTTPKQATLRRFPRRWWSCCRWDLGRLNVRWIEPSLLHGPDVTLVTITALLFRTLTVSRVDEKLLRCCRYNDKSSYKSRCRQPCHVSHHHTMYPSTCRALAKYPRPISRQTSLQATSFVGARFGDPGA